MAQKKKPSDRPWTVSTAVKNIFAPAQRARHSRSSRPKMTALKNVSAIVGLLLLVGAIVSAFGAERRGSSGTLTTGEDCKRDDECIRGHLCFPDRKASPRCTPLCQKSGTCPSGYTCRTQAIAGKKGHMKFKELCIRND